MEEEMTQGSIQKLTAQELSFLLVEQSFSTLALLSVEVG